MIAEYRGGTSFSLSSNFKSYQGLQPVSGINKKTPLCWTVPCATEEIVIPVFPRSNYLYLSQQSRAMAFMASIFFRISFASAIWQRVRTRLCSG